MNIKNPMHPGEFLLEAFMKPFGISVKKMADELCVSQSTVSRLINKKADLTAEMAIRLSVVVGRSPESWLNMQNNYSLNRVSADKGSLLSSLKPIEFDFDAIKFDFYDKVE